MQYLVWLQLLAKLEFNSLDVLNPKKYALTTYILNKINKKLKFNSEKWAKRPSFPLILLMIFGEQLILPRKMQ